MHSRARLGMTLEPLLWLYCSIGQISLGNTSSELSHDQRLALADASAVSRLHLVQTYDPPPASSTLSRNHSHVTRHASRITPLYPHHVLLHATRCEDPRPHAWNMCAARFCSGISPIQIQPTRAVTLPNLGVPHHIEVPHRVTYPCTSSVTTSVWPWRTRRP